MKTAAPFPSIWRHGAFLTACNLLVALTNYSFQALLARGLPMEEYGRANSCQSFSLLLALPATAAGSALTHFLARRQGTGAGFPEPGGMGRHTLFLTLLFGGVLAVVAVPLGMWCGFARPTLVSAAVACVGSHLLMIYVSAHCAGLGRYATLGCLWLASAGVRLAAGWGLIRLYPTAEAAAAAVVCGALPGLIFVWSQSVVGNAASMIRPRVTSGRVPWREVSKFFPVALLVAAASYGFTQADVLIAQRCLQAVETGRFCAAGVFARALLGLGGPLLATFFAETSRTGSKRSPWSLPALYAAAMLGGAIFLTLAAEFCMIALLGHPDAGTVVLVARFAWLMVLIGGIEAVMNWALARRQGKLIALHALLSVGYLTVGFLFNEGRPDALLQALMTGAAISFGLLAAGAVLQAWGPSRPTPAAVRSLLGAAPTSSPA